MERFAILHDSKGIVEIARSEIADFVENAPKGHLGTAQHSFCQVSSIRPDHHVPKVMHVSFALLSPLCLVMSERALVLQHSVHHSTLRDINAALDRFIDFSAGPSEQTPRCL